MSTAGTQPVKARGTGYAQSDAGISYKHERAFTPDGCSFKVAPREAAHSGTSELKNVSTTPARWDLQVSNT